MTTHRCPYCNRQFVVKNIITRIEREARRKRGQFESEAKDWLATPRRGVFGAALDLFDIVVRGKSTERPPSREPVKVYVYSERKESKYRTLLNDRQLDITPDQAREIAKLYLLTAHTWSRANTTRYTSLSQPQHNKLTDDFVRLLFLRQEHSRAYRLTGHGKAFLKLFLEPGGAKMGGR